MSEEFLDEGPYPKDPARCVVCGDALQVLVDRREPFPEHWYVSAVHDHSDDPVRWVVAVHLHRDRQRYAPEAKWVLELQAFMKKKARQKRQVRNASR